VEDRNVSEPKKPGARDISDLKARLGLKKGAEGGPAPRSTTSMPSVGVPPPTAAKIGGSFVPPPPGVAPPPGAFPAAPPQPVIPDASVDPFGAMNAMASTAARTAPVQPEFVIVNDGKHEQVASRGGGLRWLKIGLLVAVPLFVGYVVGGINNANNNINNAIDDAKLLYDDFTAVGKNLQDIEAALDAAKDRGKGQLFPHDKELTAALDAMKLQAPDTTKLFHANMQNMSPSVPEKVFSFYTGVTALYAKIENHKRIAKADERKQIEKKEVGQYATVLRVPSDEKQSPYVELVEVGAPICKGDTKISAQGCDASKPPEKFQVRTDPTGSWQIVPFASTSTDVAKDVILMIGDNNVKNAFMVGAKEFVDTVGYMQRIREIDAQVRELSQQRADVQNALTLEKQKSKSFAL
jgi:hypothetical protein